MMILIKYSAFAGIAILVNLVFQKISSLIYTAQYELYVAMFVGTLAGLIVKYILDKNFIFYEQSANKKQVGKTFILYSMTGVFTTLLFWGMEILFENMFEDENARYLGAIIGLGLGYLCKYYLDKYFVFKAKPA